MTRRLVLAILALGLAAPAWGQDAAWVLADRAAREAGLWLEASGQKVDAVLPVELERDLELTVHDGDRVGRAWVEAGLLYVVQGRQGRLRATRPGVDVDADAVGLHADEATARDLAAEVGATVEADGRAWVIRAPDVLLELAYAALPGDDLDLVLLPMPRTTRSGVVKPVKVGSARLPRGRSSRVRVVRRADQSPVANATSAVALTVTDHPTVDGPHPGEAPADLVAWYCDEARCLVLGVDGQAHRCDADGCGELGPWWAWDDGVQVGPARYRWSAGTLVLESEAPKEVTR